MRELRSEIQFLSSFRRAQQYGYLKLRGWFDLQFFSPNYWEYELENGELQKKQPSPINGRKTHETKQMFFVK
jgi:hypothetical protein